MEIPHARRLGSARWTGGESKTSGEIHLWRAPLPNQILDSETEVRLEQGERRVTRTLASALAAIDKIVIRQAREPSADDVMDMVQSGVSKELVSAVRAIAMDAGVHAFETHFRWAAGIGAPGGIPNRILIPEDAGTLLRRVETKLQRAKPDMDQSISGQIIEIRHIPGEPLGEVAVRTIRGNRTAEVRITTTARVTNEAAGWFKSGRAVIARGLVVSTPGRPLSMPNPSALRPMDELFVEVPR
jgi:hypothetical protein